MIYDAHMHLNLQELKPVENLVARMDSHNIEKALLIINNEQEERCFYKHIDEYWGNSERLHIAVGLNPHAKAPFSFRSTLAVLGISTAIKLHPRIMNITADDFERVIQLLSEANFDTVIIDTLYYGHKLENHVGIELGIELATKFTDKKVVLAHSGSVRLLECMMSTRWLENIYYDMSFITSYFSETSLRFDMINLLRHTSDKIMYGSDYPTFDLTRAYDGFIQLCTEAGLGKSEMDRVLITNAEKVYR